jgi:hypothetical protein
VLAQLEALPLLVTLVEAERLGDSLGESLTVEHGEEDCDAVEHIVEVVLTEFVAQAENESLGEGESDGEGVPLPLRNGEAVPEGQLEPEREGVTVPVTHAETEEEWDALGLCVPVSLAEGGGVEDGERV